MEKLSTQEPSKGALASVVAGILVIITGFIIYNYFSKSEGEITKESEKTTLSEENTENNGVSQDAAKVESPSLDNAIRETPQTIGQVPTEWTANQYKNGDIKGSEYKVVKGDTLWQIAQAKYGDPYQWTKIRDANKIGNLPNGNPYIEIGQMLILPD